MRRVPAVAATILVLLAAICGAHAVAAGQHTSQAASHRQMLTAAGVSTEQAEPQGGELGEMAEHASIEARIGGLLWYSVAAGLLLIVWGALAVRRPTRYRYLPWLAATGLAGLVALVAGIASRTSFGLLGHTDDTTWLWAATITAEFAVVVGVAAALAAEAVAGAAFTLAAGRPVQLARAATIRR